MDGHEYFICDFCFVNWNMCIYIYIKMVQTFYKYSKQVSKLAINFYREYTFIFIKIVKNKYLLFLN